MLREALDVAFRLLDAARVKRALRETADPADPGRLEDIYSSVVRHGYDGSTRTPSTSSCASRSQATATQAGSAPPSKPAAPGDSNRLRHPPDIVVSHGRSQTIASLVSLAKGLDPQSLKLQYEIRLTEPEPSPSPSRFRPSAD